MRGRYSYYVIRSHGMAQMTANCPADRHSILTHSTLVAGPRLLTLTFSIQYVNINMSFGLCPFSALQSSRCVIMSRLIQF